MDRGIASMGTTVVRNGETNSPGKNGLEARLEAAAGGDCEALARLLEPFRDYLLLVANHELEPELRAKLGASDLVQETFVGAQRDLARFRGNSEADWRLWLRGILVHLLANHRRQYRSTGKRRIDLEVPLASSPRCEWPAFHPSPSADLSAREDEAALLAALDGLAEHHRQVVLWHHRDRLPFEEIGHRLGVSADAARKQWERALKTLRRELKRNHGFSEHS
jgi:RNA polymerase sigma-70 factor (ECF subfamily)